MMELTLPLLAAALFVLLGAVVQGSVGFGVGMIAAPVLMWAIPESMPATLVILGGAMTIATLVTHWRDIDLPAMGWALLGRVPGLALGAWLVVTMPAGALGVLVGFAVVVAVVMQWSRWTIPKSPRNLVLAGSLSGTTGTATGIGGPPVAMVLANDPGPVVRATLAAYFLVGSLMSLGALASVGQLDFDHLTDALALLPALIVGALLAKPVARHLDDGRTRKAILILAAASGLVLALTSLVGAP